MPPTGPESPSGNPRKLAILMLAMVAVPSVAAACDDDPTSTAQDDVLELETRVHLVSSPESEALTTTLEGEVDRLFEAVNEVWRQAGIEWQPVAVGPVESPGGQAFQDIVDGEEPPDAGVLWDAIPREELTEGAWDVFLIRDLGGMAGGIYFPGLEAILQPERAPDGSRELEGALTRILSHELGHGLGLPHVPCTSDGNLMAPGCRSGDRTRLAPDQVDSARDQALRGPYRGGGASF